MKTRRIATTLFVCFLAWTAHACAIIPWDANERPAQQPDVPVTAPQKAEKSRPQASGAKPKLAQTGPGLERKPTLKPVEAAESPTPSEPARMGKPEPRPGPQAIPNSEGVKRQETTPDVASEPQSKPERTESILEPTPTPVEPRSAPEPIPQPSPSPEPEGEPALLETPAPKSAQVPLTPARALRPQLSPAPPSQAELEPEQKPEAGPMPEPSSTASSISLPELVLETPPIIPPFDNPPDSWFEETFKHWRPERVSIPRWLREPIPPLFLPSEVGPLSP
jgi:hypothetical protein